MGPIAFMMYRNTLLLLCFCLPVCAFAQRVSGNVRNERMEALPAAYVHWVGNAQGVYTDEAGRFAIAADGIADKRLVAWHADHLPDTLNLGDSLYASFVLRLLTTLDDVVIQAQRQGVIIADHKPIKTEQITQTELAKAACCDLAGCFETQTTVQPQTTNVITNAKELRILGLSGVYNQVLIDGFPLIQGLTYTYGISSIPGTLVDNIYVSKGANSVLQGFESISGQINVETKEPDKMERFLLNMYANGFGERHFNTHGVFRRGKWSNLTAFHTIQPAGKRDRDQDNFLDLPRLTRYLISNKWKYGNERENGWNSRIGLRFLNEQRIGGQRDYHVTSDLGSTRVYGQYVRMNQPELWTKTGYRLNDRHNFVLFASALYQQQNSWFGTVRYDATQTAAYGNLQYELRYAAHDLKTGISYRHLDLQEEIGFTDTALRRSYAGNYRRLEHIAGFFAENTMRFFNDRLTWIAGLRSDHHNRFGRQFTPRTLLKYDLAPRTIVRANLGHGWRTVNLFSENIGLLVSSRDIVFEAPLEPERAWNMGLNLTHKFETADNNLSGYFSADFYRTTFGNQIFPDYDTDPRKAIIQNFTGKSISNGFQAELSLSIFRRFEWKNGYNFLDVYRVIGDVRRELPFNARHKFLSSFSFKPLSDDFHVDVNVHRYGRQRLPDTKSNPSEFRRPDYSEPYTVANVQCTWNLKQFEVYAGCENLFDFRQLQPILSWRDPFGPYFDTSAVWGPTRGREVYIGFRFKLKQKS